MDHLHQHPPHWAIWTLLILTASTLCLLRWGSRFLIAEDVLPAKADCIVILQGSFQGEKARIEGAVRLLNTGVSNRLLLSVPKESYWGQTIAPIASNYLTKTYGSNIAELTDFCETGPKIDSTEQEANVLIGCIKQSSLHSLIIVTSDYHTRRAGIIWKRAIRSQSSSVRLWIYGVADPEFHAQRWWQSRLSAKTWLMEFTKLICELPSV